MANDRIFYAIQQVGLKADGSGGSFTAIKGATSVGMSANYNVNPLTTLSQLEIYENSEDLPDVEVSMTKMLDGHPLIYTLATTQATAPNLLNRAKRQCIFALSIFDDDQESASGAATSIAQCSGMFVGSVSFSFGVGNEPFTEDVTLIGNDRVWLNDPKPTNPNLPTPSFDGVFGSFVGPIGDGGVNTQENLIWSYDASNGLDTNNMVADSDATILPPEVYGISDSGTNELVADEYGAHVQSISVSCDFGREDIDELGRKGPYARTLTPPVEVTCDVEVISSSGDMLSFIEAGIYSTGTDPCQYGGNTKDRTIRIATCEGTRLYLGTKNRIQSANYGGGDAGGGNVTVTYGFRTYNDFVVMHSSDPNANFTWANRNTYLRDVA